MPVVSTNHPRFDDSDFERRDKTMTSVKSQESLGISERGWELLKGVNDILDSVSTDSKNAVNAPVIIQFPKQTEPRNEISAEEER